ncbi:hypothetical protein AX279_11100 [Pseudomonas sp. J237]|nr:hypothetical protein AX279_11100 [Pseudomonas sp. J237]
MLSRSKASPERFFVAWYGVRQQHLLLPFAAGLRIINWQAPGLRGQLGEVILLVGFQGAQLASGQCFNGIRHTRSPHLAHGIEDRSQELGIVLRHTRVILPFLALAKSRGQAAQANLFLRRAAAPLAGRSFTLYEQVHDREGCPKRQQQLLKTLACLLPGNCRPILVTDAGFRRPWFQAVEAQGWHYVGWVRNRDLYRTAEGVWAPIKQLYEQASTTHPGRSGRSK